MAHQKSNVRDLFTMLIKFSVNNFKCFEDTAELSMVAASFSQLPHHVTTEPLLVGTNSVVRAAAIYGANASGKSKFIDGLYTLKNIVVTSRLPHQSLGIEPFRLSMTSEKRPTELEIMYSIDDRLFQYGLIVDNKIIHEEWLFELTKGKQRCCFERVTKQDNKVLVSIGPAFGASNSKEYKKLQLVSATTGPNQSFLNKAWANQSPKAAIAIKWFTDVLEIVGADAEFKSIESVVSKDEEFSAFVADYLKSAGTGIDNIQTTENVVDLDSALSQLNDEIKQKAIQDIEKGMTLVISSANGNLSKVSKEDGRYIEYQLQAAHLLKDGTSVFFDFKSESHGTQRLVNLLPIVYQARLSTRVFVIDELDRKLHTLLTRQFLAGFLSGTKDTKSQIIFSTHDTNLLDQDVLRRDEIWFVEKCANNGCSVLYPLTDYEPRHDLKLDKGYLLGRFGAVPFFGDFEKSLPEHT